MKLFFIQGGSRLKQDTAGLWYTDSNFNNAIWDRYKSLCDELVVILRRETQIYEPEYAMEHFSPVDEAGMKLVPVPDLYSPVRNFFNPTLRNEVKGAIDSAVNECDKAIIRSGGNFYVTYAGECCRALHRPYLSEVTGFIYEGLMEHGTLGKLKAKPSELAAKKLFAGASYATYVTTRALQERYPCPGRCEACSDVQIQNLDESAVSARHSINLKGGVTLGTAAALDVTLKGHSVAVEALSTLHKRGLKNVSYELAGLGTGDAIRQAAKKRGVLNQIAFIGGLPHDKVFGWLDSIDIYIQPSFQEGLSRSIVEAMSRACPIIATDVGGNSELIDAEWLVPAGDSEALANKIQQMIENPELAANQSRRNFEKAKAFAKEKLDIKRDAFYREFVGQK
jgi:glycosyltransferase involved in cell wall biosynthesis